MQHVYAEEFIVTFPFATPISVETSEEIMHKEIEHTRDKLRKLMEKDGADPRHYLWTVHKILMFVAGYVYAITAERHPDDTIERINEQIKVDQGSW